jgi:hypothetical protein
VTAEPDPLDIFTERGISEEVRRRRPYVWWSLEDLEPVKEPYSDLSPGQRGFMSNLAGQSPGWVITRHPPPMIPGLARIYPEIRPIYPVRTDGPTHHWHGDGEPPEDLKWSQTMPGDRKNWQEHIDRGKDPKHPKPDVDLSHYPEEKRPKYNVNSHKGVNTEELHWHQDFAKYTHCPPEKFDDPYEHDHESSWKKNAAAKRPVIRVAHVAKRGKRGHDGVDVEGLHWHTERKKPTDSGMARRIDLHPMAVLPLIQSPVVFFVIEGCFKADAILSAGHAAFSVPAVGQWGCPELKDFAVEYLLDKTVVIVPDADWRDNKLVINQAILCQTQLMRLGVDSVYVAAPPGPLKGVDDFLGAGGDLNDLIVVSHDPPAEHIEEWVASHSRRRDQARRNEWLVFSLSMFTGPSGELKAPLQSVAKVIGMKKVRAWRSIWDLERLGAVEVTGRLDVKQNYLGSHWDREQQRRIGGWEWASRPTITLIRGLRSTQVRQRLGDLIQLTAINRTFTKELQHER